LCEEKTGLFLTVFAILTFMIKDDLMMMLITFQITMLLLFLDLFSVRKKAFVPILNKKKHSKQTKTHKWYFLTKGEEKQP